MTKRFKNSKLRTACGFLIGALLVPTFTIFAGAWLMLQYTQPQLTLYTDGYYEKVGDDSVGSIYVVNDGRQPDKNVTIAINEEIKDSELTINYTTNQWTSEIKGGLTYITGPVINPKEGVEVNFAIISDDSSFEVADFNSSSGNTRQREWIEPWWHFSSWQAGVLLVGLSLIFFSAFAIGRRFGMLGSRKA